MNAFPFEPPSPHFLDGSELGTVGIARLVERSFELATGAKPYQFQGSRIAALFFNPSLRTRTSLEFAASSLGAKLVTLSAGQGLWQIEHRQGAVMNEDKAEHIAEVAGVLSEMAHITALRTFAGLEDKSADLNDQKLSSFIQHASNKVINLESALWHPLQGLADTATWVNRLGDLKGKRITLTWAPHPKPLPTAVANQVLLSAAMQGMEITLAHPKPFDLPPHIVQRCTTLARENGGALQIKHNPNEAYDGAHVVVAKSWSGVSGYGQRSNETRQRQTYLDWMVTKDKMDQTDRAGFMHCLPVRRNVVVADEVIDGPQSWTKYTAGMRMWTAMAVLEHMLEKI